MGSNPNAEKTRSAGVMRKRQAHLRVSARIPSANNILLARADGVIVGSSVRENGKAGARLLPDRLEAMASAFRQAVG